MPITAPLLEFAHQYGFADQLISLSLPEIKLANSRWNDLQNLFPNDWQLAFKYFVAITDPQLRFEFFTGKTRLISLNFLDLAYNRGVADKFVAAPEAGFLEFNEDIDLARKVLERIPENDLELAETALTLTKFDFDLNSSRVFPGLQSVIFELIAAGIIHPEILKGEARSMHEHFSLTQEVEDYLEHMRSSSIEMCYPRLLLGKPAYDGLYKDSDTLRNGIIAGGLANIHQQCPEVFELLETGQLSAEQFVSWFKDKPVISSEAMKTHPYSFPHTELKVEFNVTERIIPLAALGKTDPSSHKTLLGELRLGINTQALAYNHSELQSFANLNRLSQTESVQSQKPQSRGFLQKILLLGIE